MFADIESFLVIIDGAAVGFCSDGLSSSSSLGVSLVILGDDIDSTSWAWLLLAVLLFCTLPNNNIML